MVHTDVRLQRAGWLRGLTAIGESRWRIHCKYGLIRCQLAALAQYGHERRYFACGPCATHVNFTDIFGLPHHQEVTRVMVVVIRLIGELPLRYMEGPG